MEKKKLTLKKEVVSSLSNSNLHGGAGGPDTFYSNCLCESKKGTCTNCPEEVYLTDYKPIDADYSCKDAYCVPLETFHCEETEVIVKTERCL